MGAAEAYIQGGAALLLVVVVSAIILYLKNDNKTLRQENKDLYQESLNLLKRYQDRDQEELRAFRDAEHRRREGAQ